MNIEDKELLELLGKLKQYIEYVEVALDGEWGKCRDLDALIEPDKASKPQGVWCFQPEDLEGLELDALIEPDKASKPQGVWCFQPEDLEGLELDAMPPVYSEITKTIDAIGEKG